jgi:hypothetical protein
MRSPFVLTFAATAALGAACSKEPPATTTGVAGSVEPATTKPDPSPSASLATGSIRFRPPLNPPIPRPLEAKLPSWDDVLSGHPPNATNPPSPVLVVDPGGACFKKWAGGMIQAPPDHVEACAGAADVADRCGVAIECPQPRAQALLDAYRAKQK